MNILNTNLLVLDYFIIILSSIVIIFSIWKGFINSILGLLTWIGSLFITIYTYEYLSSYLNNLILNIDFFSGFDQLVSILSIIITIPIIFLISLFILKKIRKILSSDLDKQIFGLIFDKFFGAIYGLLFSYVIFSTILYFTKDNRINTLNDLNIFLAENSNILSNISEYNNNIIQLYRDRNIE